MQGLTLLGARYSQHCMLSGHLLRRSPALYPLCKWKVRTTTNSFHLLQAQISTQLQCGPAALTYCRTEQSPKVCNRTCTKSFLNSQCNTSAFSSVFTYGYTSISPYCTSQHRLFSLSATVSNESITNVSQTVGNNTNTGSAYTPDLATTAVSTEPATPLESVVETSAQAKWASDASEAITDLSAQDSISSLGLGGYSPIGLIQWSLEWIHVNTGLPWWASIIVATVILRSAMFPLAVRVQANAARFNNIRPETEKLMAKVKHHNRFGRKNLSAMANKKLMDMYSEHNCSPLKMMITPFIQVPIFISFFIAIRRMASVPVESMKSGGALWFTDLTAPDPYYILPFLSCASLLATIEMGGEAGVTNPQLEKMKTVFRAFSILLIPVTAQFPTGLFMYWLTSSMFSIGQILLLKVPGIRYKLGIPELVTTPDHVKSTENSKGFVQMLKENYNTAVVDDEAKKKKMAAKKRYNQLIKDKSPKLYDQPPHLRKRQ